MWPEIVNPLLATRCEILVNSAKFLVTLATREAQLQTLIIKNKKLPKNIHMNKINLGPISSHSSLEFKFLRVRNFLSVNFQLFANRMISATDSYSSYITGVECTQSLITTSLTTSKNMGSMDLVHGPGPWRGSMFCTFPWLLSCEWTKMFIRCCRM